MNTALQTFRDSFMPLRIRNYRVYISGQFISLLGTWMQVTAQGWIVWELSKSTEALGFATMLSSLPFLLLGPFSGTLADRADRRRLLIGLQTGAMILAFTQAILMQTGLIQLWHVYALSLLLGVINALDLPTQQAFIGDLAGMGLVRKAVVVNAMALQIGRMVGPALAGFVVGALGAAPAFWLNGLSFIAVIATLMAVQTEKNNDKRKNNEQVPGGFGEVLRFIREQPRIQDLLIFTALITFFGLSVLNIFPSVASEVLGGGAETLGLLLGASGAGAFVSTIFVVPFTQAVRRTGVMLTGALVWVGMWIIVLSLSKWLPLSMAATFMFSIGAPVVITTSIGLLQIMSPPNMRARLQSTLFMFSFGLQPVASLFVGFTAERLGTPTTIQINGLLMIVGAVLLLAARANLRTWEVKRVETVTAAPVEAVL